jgi:hypothetical protein
LTRGQTKSCGGQTKSCGCLKHLSYRWQGFEEISQSYWWLVINKARRRNIPFEITIEEAWALFIHQNRKCALTGVNLKFTKTSSVILKTLKGEETEFAKSKEEVYAGKISPINKMFSLVQSVRHFGKILS